MTLQPTTNGVHRTSHTETDTKVLNSLTPIPACISAFASGSFLIVLDAPTRENEGDLIIAATHLTTSKAAFLIRHTSGYLCAPLSAERAKMLDLRPMVDLRENEDKNRTNYTITVDAVRGLAPLEEVVTTGISAHDRAVTCRVLGDERSTAEHLRRPGHVVPLVAREGGVRERRGHTEAGWELCRLAGIKPEVAVIGEMVIDGEEDHGEVLVNGNADVDGAARRKPEYVGSGMMRAKECVEFGRKWGIPVCTIEDLVAYVEEKEGPLSAEHSVKVR